MDITIYPNPNLNKAIATIFYALYISTIVTWYERQIVAIPLNKNWITAKQNYRQIWIAIDRSLVKWAISRPDLYMYIHVRIGFPQL